MTRYAKALVAFFTALGTWGVTAYADDAISAVELFGLCGVAVATLSVFIVPNEPPVGEPRDPNISERVPEDLPYDPEHTTPEVGAVTLLEAFGIALLVIVVLVVLF